MKRIKKNIEYKILTLLLLASTTFTPTEIWAQDMNDLAVKWEKTYIKGYGYNMKANTNKDGYVVSGWGNVKEGMVIEIDEEGNILRSVTTHVSLVYTPVAPEAWARFNTAFKTDDGGIIAFGTIWDKGAPEADKMTNYTGLPMSENGYLLHGAWFVKYDADLNVVNSGRLRGSQMIEGCRTTNGNFLIVGTDQPREGVAGTSNDISLVRLYDLDGNLIKDGRADYSSMTSLYQYPGTDHFILASNNRLMKVDVLGNNIDITNPRALNSLGLTNLIEPYINYISPTVDGGVFVNTNLDSKSNVAQNFANGTGTYRLNADFSEQYYTTKSPATELYIPPLLLTGNIYVGTYRACTSATLCTNYMYQLTDDGTFNVKKGDPLPVGTTIRAVSTSDGFFSTGTSGGNVKVAKMTTCANFKISDGDIPSGNSIHMEHSPTLNLTLPLNYEGAKATAQADVTYSLLVTVESGTVNGITPSMNGGELEKTTNQTVNSYSTGKGEVISINKNYTIGADPVTIKYILTIKDSYETAGVPQSCGQTYVFYLKSVPQTDVVVMPTVDSQSGKINMAIKNIGLSSFKSPFNITVYKNTLGNNDKHVYSYPNIISRGETVHFEIDASSLSGATKYVVNINDNGGATNKDQPEMKDKEFTYEVGL